MPSISHTSKQSLARIFALVALLCAGALQVQEAGHDHWNSLDDSFSQCLVCKTGAAALPSGIPATVLPLTRFCSKIPATQPTLAPSSVAFQARGPPSYS